MANRSSAKGESGRSFSAAARAARTTSTGSAHGSAARARTTSPSWATTSLASGVRLTAPPPNVPGSQPARRQCAWRSAPDLDPAPGDIQRQPDRACGFIGPAEQRVGVGQAKGAGQLRLLLLPDDVLVAFEPSMQLAADIEQRAVRLPHRLRIVHQLRDRKCVQDLRVSKAALRVLQVGLEQERAHPRRCASGRSRFPAIREPAWAPWPATNRGAAPATGRIHRYPL